MQLDTVEPRYINEIEIYKQRYQELETRNQELEHRIKEIKNEYETSVNEYQFKYLELKEKYDLLIYKRFGRSAEQLLADEKQSQLFVEETTQFPDEADKPEELQTVASFNRKKPGRKPLSPHLPRKETIKDIPENDRICACGAELTIIGQEISERLQIIPPELYVEKTIRIKRACRNCEGTEDENKPTVRIVPVEPSLIPRSIASPSLLSTIITQKYDMHLPYYRQETQFKQIGVVISRQDMAKWQQQVYQKLTPLFTLLKGTVKSGPVLQMDETTVQVMGEEERKDTQKSYMWLARGGPPGKAVVWYEYHPTRRAYYAKTFLEGYKGYLQTDGYEAYDTAVEGNTDIIHVGCFAHSRRKFFEAAKASKKPLSAEEGIKHIRKLYIVEDELRNKSMDEERFFTERKARAGPILEEFHIWLLKRKEELVPSSLLALAVSYTLKQWDKLVAYLESPYLTPDNNAAENAIRPFVLGRRNWIFNKSPEGAESSCGMFTLIETAKQNGLVPFKYLMKLFEKVPYAASLEDWKKLQPWNIFIGQ